MTDNELIKLLEDENLGKKVIYAYSHMSDFKHSMTYILARYIEKIFSSMRVISFDTYDQYIYEGDLSELYSEIFERYSSEDLCEEYAELFNQEFQAYTLDEWIVNTYILNNKYDIKLPANYKGASDLRLGKSVLAFKLVKQ